MYKPLVEFPLLCGGEKEDVYKVLTIPDTPLYLWLGWQKVSTWSSSVSQKHATL